MTWSWRTTFHGLTYLATERSNEDQRRKEIIDSIDEHQYVYGWINHSLIVDHESNCEHDWIPHVHFVISTGDTHTHPDRATLVAIFRGCSAPKDQQQELPGSLRTPWSSLTWLTVAVIYVYIYTYVYYILSISIYKNIFDIYLSIHPSIYLSINRPVYLPIYLSFYLIYLIYLFYLIYLIYQIYLIYLIYLTYRIYLIYLI
jgi:hypothetical protein